MKIICENSPDLEGITNLLDNFEVIGWGCAVHVGIHYALLKTR